jgi:TPP-dependent pyruvate/acetoin dehydrogenase alpha subunit
MAKFFKNRDFRSGYYRDQTFMMAIGQLTVQQFLPDCMGIQILNKNLCLGRQMGGILPPQFE